MFIDLEWEVRTNGEFRSRIEWFSSELERLGPKSTQTDAAAAEFNGRLREMIQFCSFNLVFLTGYYFPRYPKDKPLYFGNYPFAFQMFENMIGGHTVVRGSRQISKSTSFSVRQLLNARLFPSFRSFYICPRNDQLETYANKLREVEQASRFYETGTKKLRSNLNYKEFKNRSIIELAYVLTTASNVRGKAGDEILMDECLSPNSLLWNGQQFRPLIEFSPGDRIIAFDNNGSLHEDHVRAINPKGKRAVWRITLTNGQQLECTSNEKLWTNYGWLYLSQALSKQEIARCPKAVALSRFFSSDSTDAFRDTFGRRNDAMARYQKWPVSNETRSMPGSLLPKQSSIIKGLYSYASENCSERWLGERKLHFFNGDFSSIRIFTLPLLQAGFSESNTIKETSQFEVAKAVDLGGNCLVVSRRWFDRRYGKLPCRNIQYSCFFEKGSSITSQVALQPWNNCQSVACLQKENKQILLGCLHRSSCYPYFDRKNKTFFTPFDVVQKQCLSDSRKLLHLRPTNHKPDSKSQFKISLLLQSEVQTKEKPRSGDSVGEENGFRDFECQRTLQQKDSDSQRSWIFTSISETTQKTFSRSDLSCQLQRSSASMAASPETTRIAENVALQPVSIQSIEFIGEQDVYDIETEKHHTFFANGFAVHNCQDFDPDLELETYQLQSASENPIRFYAGTSLTTDSFLEQKYLDSSMCSWVSRCGCGTYNIPLLEFNVLDMIQPHGPACYKCARPLDIRSGKFVPANPHLHEVGYRGYHIPQIIVPAVYQNAIRWSEIYRAKVRHGGDRKFLQEFLGIATEEGEREVTRQNLINICTLGNNLRVLHERAINHQYQFVISGCDWGGSDYIPGLTKVSTTVHVMAGITADGSFEIIHIRRYHGMSYDEIAGDIIANHQRLNGNALASDFGVGTHYNALLRDVIAPEKHLVFGYVGPSCPLISEPDKGHMYNQWSVNKTDSISQLYAAIRISRIRCFDWELSGEFLSDFLNLYRAPAETPGGATTFRYIASASKPNDTLQATNYVYLLGRILLGGTLFADFSMQIRLNQALQGGIVFGDSDATGAYSG